MDASEMLDHERKEKETETEMEKEKERPPKQPHDVREQDTEKEMEKEMVPEREKEKEKQRDREREKERRSYYQFERTPRKGNEKEKENGSTMTDPKKMGGKKDVTGRHSNLFEDTYEILDRAVHAVLASEKGMAELERKADSHDLPLHELEMLVAIMNNVLAMMEVEEVDGAESNDRVKGKEGEDRERAKEEEEGEKKKKKKGGEDGRALQKASVMMWLKTSVRNLQAKELKEDEGEDSKKEGPRQRREKLKERIQQRLAYARAHTTDFMERLENGEMDDDELISGVKMLDGVLSVLKKRDL